MKVLVWYIGINTGFEKNPGKFGKDFKKYLEPGFWDMLEGTYADAGYQSSWDALFTMCELFRNTACAVADHFGYDYPQQDDDRVYAHLRHVHSLPKNAREMYP